MDKQLTTPISKLLANENTMKQVADPGSQFANMPNQMPPQINQQQQAAMQMQQQAMQQQAMQQMRELNRPVTNELPSGQGQGVTAPMKREYFSVKNIDYKTAGLVFAILLIFTSTVFYSSIRGYVPGIIGSDGKITAMGNFVAAMLGTLTFIMVKYFAKL
jgi:hypothetical protein